MAIYVFSLLTGYQLSGVDYAQGKRNDYLKKVNQPVKYVFTDVPKKRDIQVYKNLGIQEAQMLCSQLFFCEKNHFSGDSEVSEKIEELKNHLGINNITDRGERIDLYIDKKKVASLILKDNRAFFSEILFFKNEKLVVSEFYTDKLLYRNYYATKKKDGIEYAALVRRVFLDDEGKNVYECLYEENKPQKYIFPNGMYYNRRQFLEFFIKNLNLKEDDVVLIDRPSYMDYIQPLLEYGNKAKILVFFHSGHYFEKGENAGSLYLNKEYYNWFRFSDKIDRVLVSTEEQKQDLIRDLTRFHCNIPKIEVVPIGGIDQLRYQKKERKKHSLLTVSRIVEGKRIEWLISSVIEAHNKIPDICLDIFGDGSAEYLSYLKQLVKENHADDYIRFMGHADVREVYQNYEGYITTSTFETYGLSVMEAIGSGNIIFGLNVRYGNRLFVENEKNGRMIDFSAQDSSNNEAVKKMVSELANAIIDTFEDEEKMQKYRENSYAIAERFMDKKIEKKWIELMESLSNREQSIMMHRKGMRNGMVYNFNLGIGWASSGVEYAQSYRAAMLRSIGVDAKFVFTDMFVKDNIQHMTENIGFLDSEIMWLYTFFTDTKIAPVSYTLAQLEKSFGKRDYTFTRDGKAAKYVFEGSGNFYVVYLVDETSDRVHRVEHISNGCLIRKDYYTYCRIYSEYYAPLNKQAHFYQRRFFNEDGSVAYEEITDNNVVMYQFPDKILYSKEELVGYMVSCLNLTENDVVIIDRTKDFGQTILQNVGPAKVGIIIHADHFSENETDDDNILWNNYYEYAFAQHKHIDFYVTATDDQNRLVREQFLKYKGIEPNVVTIPVGSLDELKYPEKSRKPYSLITASRLAKEKHVDWLVEAVAEARKQIPDISLDIYGKGGEEAKLRELIEKLECADCIRLCGQQNLTDVYKNYEAYFSGSTSEGFGLTLMEAVGSGLPIIGFDVRYGNQNFIDHEQNGYKIPVHDKMDGKERVQKLTECLVRLFKEADLESFHQHSYEKAQTYLTTEVEKRWANILMK